MELNKAIIDLKLQQLIREETTSTGARIYTWEDTYKEKEK
jgi:hypothetical protein